MQLIGFEFGAGAEIAVVVPPTRFGGYNTDLLAACRALGVNEVYRIGGAQGVAALAYGLEAIGFALIVILTRQHALIEGVPGVAKTLLARTLGRVLGCEFARIQFTPDLMPADITGTNVFNLSRNEFTLVRGPVFTSFLLADEINRAPAKTQSALLQAMQERTVTIDRETHTLPDNFTVFATQNPIEYEGTYPLPEAQKDRFLLKIPMYAPDREHELELARRMLGDFTSLLAQASNSEGTAP